MQSVQSIFAFPHKTILPFGVMSFVHLQQLTLQAVAKMVRGLQQFNIDDIRLHMWIFQASWPNLSLHAIQHTLRRKQCNFPGVELSPDQAVNLKTFCQAEFTPVCRTFTLSYNWTKLLQTHDTMWTKLAQTIMPPVATKDGMEITSFCELVQKLEPLYASPQQMKDCIVKCLAKSDEFEVQGNFIKRLSLSLLYFFAL